MSAEGAQCAPLRVYCVYCVYCVRCAYDMRMDEEYGTRLKRKADLVCTLILCDKISDQTIEGERKLLRQWCRKFLPEKMDLYDRIYEARFDRLISQFRS